MTLKIFIVAQLRRRARGIATDDKGACTPGEKNERMYRPGRKIVYKIFSGFRIRTLVSIGVVDFNVRSLCAVRDIFYK